MFGRQTEGSVVCPSCGNLVGVRDDECLGCGRRNPGLWGFAPLLAKFGRGRLDDTFIQFVTVACVVMYVATLLAGSIRMGGGIMGFLSPSVNGLFLFGASGSTPVFAYGRWWTLLSATWLHGGLIHIFFNMYAVRIIAPAIIEFYGLSRMILIYTISGVTGFLATSVVAYFFPFAPQLLRGGEFTVGASASLLGLIGAVMYYGRRSGSRGVVEQVKPWLIYIVGFGVVATLFGIARVDNWAHLGGFVGGYAVSAWLDPLRPERLDHSLGALACVVLSAISIVLSVVHGLQFLP